MDAKLKHLEMIQVVINRMAGNLFFLKGWTITLVVGLFALVASKNLNPIYAVLAFLPVLVFWILDGYFLSMERSFRDLYDHVRTIDPKDVDFAMDPRPYKEANPRNGWIASIFSATLVWFYLPIVMAVLLLMWKLFGH